MKNPSKINLLHLSQYSILDQLHLEEALLRADNRNWFLINQNPLEAIVMGISTQPEQVVDFNKLTKKSVPLIRRFSGGGTVFIDHNCMMTTFICNQEEVGVPCFPQPVLQWSERFYQPTFEGLEFRLRENDYVLGEKKFGGNAQYMTKQRWLHHTSLLWDFSLEKMEYLKMPPKMPQYRQQRSHSEFLCALKEHFSNPQQLLEKILKSLENHFEIHEAQLPEALKIIDLPHRRVSILL